MQFIFYGLLIAIALVSYKLFRSALHAETKSSLDWFRERTPFAMKTIEIKKQNERRGADSRHVSQYDPEADYENVEIFYKKKTKN